MCRNYRLKCIDFNSALVYVFVGFGDEDYIIQLPYVWYYGVVKGSFFYIGRFYYRNKSTVLYTGIYRG